jgi:beta-lactam-binding protein with PASTA domain
MMKRNPITRLGPVLAIILVFVCLPTAMAQEPLAKIKAIFVNGVNKDNPSSSEMEVFRNNASLAVTKSMALFAGDRLVTRSTTRAALLYLRNAVETDKEAYIDSGADVTIRGDKSLFVRLGKALLSLGGFFDALTPDALYAAFGTEYLVEVAEDGTSTVTVFSGYVNVSSGDFSQPTTLRQSSPLNPPLLQVSYPLPGPNESDSQALNFEAPAGRAIEVEKQIRVSNNCEKKHKYKIEAPDDLKGFEMSHNNFELEARSSKNVQVEFKIDGKNIQPGVYPLNLTVRCRDCEQDQGCENSLIPMEILVTTPGTVIVRRLQELSISDESGRKVLRPVSVQRVSSNLEWSNEVIVGSQPGYPAKGIIPHFISAERRNQLFRKARFDAIWNQRPGSHEILGSIYSDWGAGAKAVEAYSRELQIDPVKRSSAGLLTGLGEAHRLKGDLERAETNLNQALKINPNWSPANNAIGNVYLDRALIASDQNKDQEAMRMLDVARQSYERASQSPEKLPQTDSVVHVNLGETYLAWGDIAKSEERPEEARRQYQEADNEFSAVSNELGQQNPFRLTGIGKVASRMGELDESTGSSSAQQFERSEATLQRTIGVYPDFAPAHMALGDLYVNRNQYEAAVQSYKRAIQVRPDDPSPNYGLGKLLEQGNPDKAAEYLYTYLQLEPKVFKQGQKAAAARSLVQEQIGTTGEDRPEPPQWLTLPATKTETVVPDHFVEVPNVKGKKRDDAIEKIQKKGLIAEAVEQPACKDFGEVLSQDPPKDTSVPKQSIVRIVVAAQGTIPVPNLTKEIREDAVQRLEQLGLGVGEIKDEETDAYPRGTISSQKPRPNTRLAQGCPVDLYVAIPVPRVPVPSYFGHTLEQVRQELPSGFLGAFSVFSLGQITYEASSDSTPGTVIRQYPEPDTMVPNRPTNRIDLVIAQVIPDSPGY